MPGLFGFFLIALNFFSCKSHVYPEVHHQNWTRSEKLDPNGILYLQWHIRNNEIVFQVTLNSRGFFAIGYPYADTRIKGFDAVFGWVNDKTGKAQLLDTYGTKNRFEEKSIIKDDTQNYHLETDGYQNLTHTVVRFRRLIETCDPRDVPFTPDTMKLYWAYGEKDVTQIEKLEFKKRGYRPIYFLNPVFKRPKSGVDSQYWDVTMKDVKITEHIGSLYWCKIFKAPETNQRQHIIGYEPLITREQRPYVHHMTLFECKFSAKNFDSEAFRKNANDLDKWTKSHGVECSSNFYSSGNWDSCVTPIASYGPGGAGQNLPDHVGIPFAGQQSYYMLEIHYENPNKLGFSDHSGFRIHYTSNLRPYDAGVMISGISISDTHLIPPKQTLFNSNGICGPSCTENVFPEHGINIVSVSVHTHTRGKSVRLSHIRNGTEINRIMEDKYYSYNYQEVRQLANETKVIPGDFLILQCSYNTEAMKRPILGGYSLHEEICLSFITYYPINELVGCYSMVPVKEFFEYFNVRAFHGISMTDVENIILYGLDAVTLNHSLPSSTDLSLTNEIKSSIDEDEEFYQNSILTRLIISDPTEFHDRTFMSHVKQLPFDDQSFAKQFENVMSTGSYMLFCRVSNKSISVPQEIIKYPVFTEIQDTTEKTCPFYIYQDLIALSKSAKSTVVNIFHLVSIFIFLLR